MSKTTKNSATRRDKPTPVSSDSTTTREKLLRAARKVYGEHGFDDVSVEKILLEAGISRPTFYRYFPDQTSIINEVVKTLNAEMMDQVVRATGIQAHAAERVRAGIEAYFQWCEDVGPVARSLFRHVQAKDGGSKSYRSRAISHFVELLHGQSAALGRAKLDPLFYDALIRVVEHLGSAIGNKNQPQDRLRRQKVAERILLASLAQDDEQDLVPSLSEISV